jgi:hypothetical protein
MTTLADAVVISMKTHARKPADLYPTPYEGTQALLPVLGLEPGSWIGEPACGDGAMARVLIANGFDVYPSDLRHTGYGEGGKDFTKATEYPDVDAIVSNPPFAMAEEFIRKAVGLAPVVAMLLKSNYWHTLRGLKLHDAGFGATEAHPISWRLAFLEKERGKSPLMDCTWFIWRKGQPAMPRPLGRPLTLPAIDPKPLTAHMADLGEALDVLTATIHGLG